MKLWLILFAFPHDGSPGLGSPQLTMGPFPDAKTCYSAAALGIDGLNGKHTDRDFRAACVADEDILPLQELAARAGAPATPPPPR